MYSDRATDYDNKIVNCPECNSEKYTMEMDIGDYVNGEWSPDVAYFHCEDCGTDEPPY